MDGSPFGTGGVFGTRAGQRRNNSVDLIRQIIRGLEAETGKPAGCPVAYGFDRLAIDRISELLKEAAQDDDFPTTIRLAMAAAANIVESLELVVQMMYRKTPDDPVMTFSQVHEAVSAMFPDLRCDGWKLKNGQPGDDADAAEAYGSGKDFGTAIRDAVVNSGAVVPEDIINYGTVTFGKDGQITEMTMNGEKVNFTESGEVIEGTEESTEPTAAEDTHASARWRARLDDVAPEGDTAEQGRADAGRYSSDGHRLDY